MSQHILLASALQSGLLEAELTELRLGTLDFTRSFRQFPQATLSSDGVLVTALLATVWHTSVAKKISRCSDGVARKENCTAWRARSCHAVLQGAPPAIITSTRGKGHFIAGPNGCKPVAHTCTPDLLCSFPQHACLSESLE